MIIAVLALAILFTGCHSQKPIPPGDSTGLPPAGETPTPTQVDPIGAAGEIQAVTVSDNPNILGTITVKGDPNGGAIYDYAVVTVVSDTTIDGAAFADLKVGMNVTVIFDGPVAESYPVQGTAASITVVEDPEQ